MFSVAAYEYHRNKVYMGVTRHPLRDTLDPFDMPDDRFKEMYRMPRCLALDFLDLLTGYMEGENLCPEVPLCIQFCAVLNFYASGSYQRRVGSDAFGMLSQTVVSRCIRSIIFVISTKMIDRFIQFPRSIDEIEQLHDEMQEHHDFPGGFAFVDGSHVPLAALKRTVEHAFVNRKGFHSINTQFVMDVRMRSERL